MSSCSNLALSNLGQFCNFEVGEGKRILFQALKKADGTLNYISKAEAAEIANWQTLFDKQNYDSDVLTKVVPTPIIFEMTPEIAEDVVFDQAGYFKKIREGDYNLNFMVNEQSPYLIKQLKDMERRQIGFYVVDTLNQVIGKESGDNIYPIPLIRVSVGNFRLPSFETVNQMPVTMRLVDPTDMNLLTSVTIADAQWDNDSDFYSLINVTGTVTSPAATGCTIAMVIDQTGDTGPTGLAFDDFTFVDQSDNSETTLAASGSLTESPDGTYTIDEASLLSAGTYTVKVEKDGYDFFIDDVVVSS
ncbi:MAG: hypothetical protein ACOC10_09465 [Bacteroidota bacterium]